MHEKTYYVIQNRNGKFFKPDNISGGYPSFVNDFEHCERYNTKDEAELFLQDSYATEMFKKEFANAIIRKIVVKVILE